MTLLVLYNNWCLVKQTHPQYQYFDNVPLVEQPHVYEGISTCVPSLAEDFENGDILQMIESLEKQTVPSDELIIVLSGSKDINCKVAYHTLLLQYSRSPLQLICIGEMLSAGIARNVAVSFARHTILAFLDADDTQTQNRNKAIIDMFDCHPNLKMLLHSFFKRKPVQERTCQQCCDLQYTAIREWDMILRQTEKRWWLAPNIAHGHAVVHYSVFKHVRFSSIRHGEDSMFCRDVLHMYHGYANATIFIDLQLTTYFKVAGRSKKKAQSPVVKMHSH